MVVFLVLGAEEILHLSESSYWPCWDHQVSLLTSNCFQEGLGGEDMDVDCRSGSHDQRKGPINCLMTAHKW